jgi:hypothetical protein
VLIAVAICWFGLAACSSKPKGVTTSSDPEPKAVTTSGASAPTTITTSAPKVTTSSTLVTTTRPGDPAVYAKIQASTSCPDLQAIFDRADTDRQAALERKNVDLAQITLFYMVAASTRMNELGC